MIIIAHAADTQALANSVKRRLSGLGYTVAQRLIAGGPPAMDGADKAQRLILLWSRGATVASFDAQIKRAAEAGKLSVVRLASSPTPARLRHAALRLPRPGEDDAAWRRLAEDGATPPPAADPQRELYREHPGSRLHGLLALAAMSLVVAGAAYAASPAFAGWIGAQFGG